MKASMMGIWTVLLLVQAAFLNHATASSAQQPSCDTCVSGSCTQECAASMVIDPLDAEHVPGRELLQGGDYSRTILFQAFNWVSHRQFQWYKVVKSSIRDFKAMHVTHVWLPPASNSVDGAPEGYLPKQLYNLGSQYGNKKDLQDLTWALGTSDIAPMADIVINHRSVDTRDLGYRDDEAHPGKRLDWGYWAVVNNDPKEYGTGNPDTGFDFDGAPDIDHTNLGVRQGLKDWLNWMKNEIGFKGWRFDYAKGYSGSFTGEYIRSSTGGGAFNVGEYWLNLNYDNGHLVYNQDSARQALVDWVLATGSTSCVFDTVTKGVLQEAVQYTQYGRLKDSQGKAAGGIGWMPDKMVTFIDNHDTGSSPNQNHWSFPGDKVAIGYTYILTHPGIPTIFWDHAMDWGADLKFVIQKLADIRYRNGIRSYSKLNIIVADDDMYLATIDNKVMVKLGPRESMGKFAPDGGKWRLSLSGQDFAVWETTGSSGKSAPTPAPKPAPKPGPKKPPTKKPPTKKPPTKPKTPTKPKAPASRPRTG